MKSWLAWFDESLIAIAKLRGDGVIATGGVLKGRRLPRTTPIDSIAILTQLAPGVVGAVRRISLDGVAHGSEVVDPETGIARSVVRIGGMRPPISAVAYVGGYGDPSAPYRRATTGTLFAGNVIQFGETYEPLLEARILGGEETAQLAALREGMREWQAAVNASAMLIFLGGANMLAPAVDPEPFWRACRRVCTTLDVLKENPPRDYGDRIQEAVIGAVKDTANDVASTAGKVVAGAANLAGETAGSFLDAFISNGSILSFLVAGIVVYKIA